MQLILALVLVAVMPAVAMAQLTVDQKVADFENVAGLYAKRYAPYEWKRDAVGFDLLNAAPWIDKILATEDDLDFYEVLSKYISKLNDAHDVYILPSNFRATLNFSVDIYDGKLLVDSIDRTRLPATEFPFFVGYELVSIDAPACQVTAPGFFAIRGGRKCSKYLATCGRVADVPLPATDATRGRRTGHLYRRVPAPGFSTRDLPDSVGQVGAPLDRRRQVHHAWGDHFDSGDDFDSIVRRRFAGGRNPRILGAFDPPAKLPRSEQNGRSVLVLWRRYLRNRCHRASSVGWDPLGIRFFPVSSRQADSGSDSSGYPITHQPIPRRPSQLSKTR